MYNIKDWRIEHIAEDNIESYKQELDPIFYACYNVSRQKKTRDGIFIVLIDNDLTSVSSKKWWVSVFRNLRFGAFRNPLFQRHQLYL